MGNPDSVPMVFSWCSRMEFLGIETPKYPLQWLYKARDFPLRGNLGSGYIPAYPLIVGKATIKKAYRKLVLKWHPDKHPENRPLEKCWEEVVFFGSRICLLRQRHLQSCNQAVHFFFQINHFYIDVMMFVFIFAQFNVLNFLFGMLRIFSWLFFNFRKCARIVAPYNIFPLSLKYQVATISRYTQGCVLSSVY